MWCPWRVGTYYFPPTLFKAVIVISILFSRFMSCIFDWFEKKKKTFPVFSLLWIRDPVQSRVLHGSLASAASKPHAVHAHAQAHHHPELQHGKLQRGATFPCRHAAAAHGSHHSSWSNRGQHHPSEPHNPYSRHQAESVHLGIPRFSSVRTGLFSPRCVSPDPCGQLLLQPSGTVDLRDISGRCTVSIGRPLDEVIFVKVESGTLNCKLQSNFEKKLLNRKDNKVLVLRGRLPCCCASTGEYVAFFDRLVFVRKCKQVTGTELTTRTNVLLVRQSLLTPGNGVVLTFHSMKNTKRSHHQGQHQSKQRGVSSDRRAVLSSIIFTRQIVTFSCFHQVASLRIQQLPTLTTPAGSSSMALPRWRSKSKRCTSDSTPPTLSLHTSWWTHTFHGKTLLQTLQNNCQCSMFVFCPDQGHGHLKDHRL